MLGIIQISVLVTILAILLRPRYVAIIYVIGNVAYILSMGQVGGWYVLAVLIPSFIPCVLGVFIGFCIREWIRPIIGNKFSIIGRNTFFRLNKHVRERKSSALNLDGTSKDSQDEESVKKESAPDKLPEQKE